MALTLDDVKKIAVLARLRFTPDEESRLTRQLGEIVDYIDRIRSFAGAEPDPLGGPGIEAEDLPRPGLPRERFLANAPRTFEAFLAVPAVKGGGGA